MNLSDEFYNRMVAAASQFRREMVSAGFGDDLLADPLVDQLDDGSVMVVMFRAPKKRRKKAEELPAFEDVATPDDLPFVELDGD